MRKPFLRGSFFSAAWCVAGLTCSLSLSGQLFAQPSPPEKNLPDSTAIEIPEDSHPREALPKELSSTNRQELYMSAYFQGLVDAKFPAEGVKVVVRNGQVKLENLPNNQQQQRAIISFIQQFVATTAITPSNRTLIATAGDDYEKEANLPAAVPANLASDGIWLPQSTILFPTMVANPRQISFSVGPRFGDSLGGHWATAVSFGDQFPLYRWTNVWGGDLEIEVEGGVFALFNMNQFSFPLLNADYYVGFPLSYAKDKWAFRLRPYHISSHVGDEYLCTNKHFKRKNKSFEAIDFYTSYQLDEHLRLYGGVGSIVQSDMSMPLKPIYLNYGFEVRAFRRNFTQLYGQPFLAFDIQNAQDTNFRFNSTCAAGYEWGKIQGIGRKIRLFAEYHNGFCPEGQFSRMRSRYFGIRLAYGF